jgi:2-keto-4-pentenoate hydratase/2-oxohepta-3-ene-1,7-dioic acid hydratase in catechol pathway
VVDWEHARLLSPVIPTKIVAVGKNYAEHAAEMGGDVPDSPVLFMKPPTSVIGPLQPIRIPQQAEEVHHEAELAVVIGSVTRNVAIEDVGPRILGYTAANDVTARDLQRADGQWTRAKGFDSFCPLGPAIDTDLDPQEGLAVISRVNGETRQSGSTADLVFGVGELVSFVSSIMTLLPGDIILTGTPSGVGPIVPGDRVEVEIEGVGVLMNPVVQA